MLLARLRLFWDRFVDKVDLVPHKEHVDDPYLAAAIGAGLMLVKQANKLVGVEELVRYRR